MKKKFKRKIHPERLSRYVTSKECMNIVDKLINLYDELTPEQRQDIKELLEKNKSEKFIINQKYKK